jgi:PBP1b-binding outer membrane lipoprotein LpoB
MDNKTISRYFVVVFIALFFTSCVTRKVNVTKNQTESHTDSSFSEKKDTSVVRNNAISVIEKLDEIEIVPIDTTKPIVINDVKYFNATLKLRKYSRAHIDTSKIISSSTIEVSGKLIKNTQAKVYVKNVDKKANSQLYLFWLLLIPIVLWLIRKFYYVGN